MELLGILFTTESCKLYHGFLNKHMNSFFQIINANLVVENDASPFIPVLNDPVNQLPSDEFLDTHLLKAYGDSHRNDSPDGNMPETRKYPPSNKTMNVPLRLREWKASMQT